MTNRFFGYIEGYYGRLLSWDERALLLEALRANSLNAYLFAPKEDTYHRQSWKVPYPNDWQRAFAAFVKKGNAAGITITPGIAPGLSFDYRSAADYSALLKKFLSLVKTGARTACLLMDDIPVTMPASCKKTFPSLGAAHGHLLTKLNKDLSKTAANVRLWFCPTVYTDQFINDDPAAVRYLPDLASSMPEGTLIFWTGPRVVSNELRRASLKHVGELFGGSICIWDNLYANDYCPNRLFFGPYCGRDPGLLRATSGILLNPTGLVHTDMLLLSLLAGYVKGHSAKAAWHEAISNLPIAKDLLDVAPFFPMPGAALPEKALAPRAVARAKDALKRLIFDWKSPLQREWYPFLYMLECDLTLPDKKDPVSRAAWVRKKYPPVLAAALSAAR